MLCGMKEDGGWEPIRAQIRLLPKGRDKREQRPKNNDKREICSENSTTF